MGSILHIFMTLKFWQAVNSDVGNQTVLIWNGLWTNVLMVMSKSQDNGYQ